tara:strand:+ start:2012 stop:2674 length:663 start_codon:yes stop_codon:yes gene_type:complete
MKIVRPLWEARRIPRKKGQPANSDKHSDLYTDENPKGTIHGLGFKDVATARASVNKIKNSGKKHAHKIQAAIAMEQRAKEMGKKAEAAVYRKYIDQMKEKTKEMQKEDAPTNATGSAVPGSGDTGDAFPRKKTKKKDWMKTAMGRKIMSKIDEVKTYVIEDKPKTKFQRIKELMYSYRGIGQYGLGTYVPTTSHTRNNDNPDEKPTAKSHTKKTNKKEKK